MAQQCLQPLHFIKVSPGKQHCCIKACKVKSHNKKHNILSQLRLEYFTVN